ncbi:tripartite tricarboxylate transporter permease [Roseibium sp. MMSF_3544]|uniref:tripartite tricarboxylate transporter permease n=1 Tax=unclassified Roseibium TaxID=2629323 RepID=UPI00273F93A1|nr:tripartite tricarboxylate transporter permease [Roseibium sp. MMSF_3544]
MSELLGNLVLGFETALLPANLAYCFLGVLLGTLIGVLPGIGSLAAVSMLLPVSFYLSPEAAIVMLAGVYYGAEYGGSTAAILLNLPGTPSSAVTAIDGNPLAKKGRAGVALFITTIASFAGGTFGIVLLIALAPTLAEMTLVFGPAEYFSMMVLGLIGAATITGGSPAKGLAMVLLGLALGTVGTDVNSGTARFTLGALELYDGVSLVALAMGLFGVAEIIQSIHTGGADQIRQKVRLREMAPTSQDMKQAGLPMARGAVIGSAIGILPGAGQTMAAFFAYAFEKIVSRSKNLFGTGHIPGIAAPEAANNAAVQSAFIPTLTLGVPGSATMAIMLGALLIHGVAPGPSLLNLNPHIFWGLVASFWIGNLLLLILNIPLIGLWVRLLQIPYRFLYPAIICLICVGVYSVNLSVFDIGLVLLFGVIGYFMRLTGFDPAPLVVGFVLGPIMEENLRRAMLIGRGDPAIFVDRPISFWLLVVSALMLVWTVFSFIRTGAGAPSNEVSSTSSNSTGENSQKRQSDE